jgi:putative spermidine/putrescine transport system ATP-binding protein
MMLGSNLTDTGSVALTAKGICKSFGDVEALSDVSFELRRGEFLTMLGPSGSGKTTTLRVIAGFMEPTKGEVWLHGKNVVRTPANARNIGMVFQDYALFPHMTIAANVGFPLETRRIPAAERKERVGKILEVVGLSNFAHRYPRQLSGGQQQRVALARALVFDPDIVLLDEPLAALDKKLRSSMQLEILRIVKSLGATVISVTHDQEEALVMSDRIALFNRGRLVQIGAPKDLYECPKTEFVADFIGDANLIEAAAKTGDGLCSVDGAGWTARFSLDDPRVRGLTPGAALCMVVRPEKIEIRADATKLGNSGCIQCQATVLQKVYLGVEYKIALAMQSGATIQVRSRDTSLVERLEPGNVVSLSWDQADVVLVKS